MRAEDEALFFGHDLISPLTNLEGAIYLLRSGSSEPDAATSESLDILSANTHILERMLGWYWRLREVEALPRSDEAWPVELLAPGLVRRIAEERLPVPAPKFDAGHGRTRVPRGPLETGLLGAGLTLAAASGCDVAWTMEARGGLLASRWELRGEQDTLDPERLFRKFYWPSRKKIPAWSDPGLPFLKAVLAPEGGTLELAWSSGTWSLDAAIPLLEPIQK